MPVVITHATQDEMVSLYHRIPAFSQPLDKAALRPDGVRSRRRGRF